MAIQKQNMRESTRALVLCVFWTLEQKLNTFMEIWRHFQNFRPTFLPRYFLWSLL